MSSSDSSEDEERNAMLREAVYEKSNDYFKVEKKSSSNAIDFQQLASRRPDKEKVSSNEDLGSIYSELELTKGAKEFLAKKLEEHLESELDSKEACFRRKHQKESQEESDGIRLFSTSHQLVTSIDSVPQKSIPRRRKISSSEDSSSEDERLNEAAVSHEFIVKQSQEVVPSNMSPADIVISKNESVSMETVNGEMNRKKKKKKKKKSKTEEVT